MKKLKVVVVCLVIVQALYNHISNSSYYYNDLVSSISFPSLVRLLQAGQYLLWFLSDLLTVVCGVLFLTSPDLLRRDRAYKMLRFIYVISSFFYLPQTIHYILTGWNSANFQHDRILIGQFVINQTIWIFCTIALLLAKPENPVRKINVSEYELVNYTTTGHRFLHYFLDMLFLLPIILFWRDYLPWYTDSALGLELLCVLLYFMYCFIAESIFRQTFGKLVTGSCIVSNGRPLSTGRVFLRTLSRLIPFDKFSFLFGGNWHDRVSSTTVVYIDSWQNAFEEQKG